MNWRLTVDEVLGWLETRECKGHYDGAITGMADLRAAGPGELSFLSGGKYERHLEASKASVILVPAGQQGEPAAGQAWIPVKDPSLALAIVCRRIEHFLRPRPAPGIHPSAVIDPSAVVDPSAHLGPFCLVGAGAMIGRGAVLESHVRVEHSAQVGEATLLQHGVVIGWGCRVGARCRLYAGAVIGADGFGYHSSREGHKPLPQIGTVVIEDDVDIGANSCVDRARFAQTRIGQGTKIDNLVQIGHNVLVGRHCILCSGVGVSGSTEIGNFVILAGQVGVNGHIRIGDGVTATGQSGITKDVTGPVVLSGTPARDHREEMRTQVLVRKLPDLTERLKALEQRLK